ncbi:hypothetical protein [Actinokineospora sp. NBRC 105648]|uniref:mechanosensitive ion channel family protein n=1 Tax=Actinokineospora sp. NBRC 105648 TaxID=3032206 RepID=UPI0024A16EC9|nr:hypothetical protein [Actinokineospora sp. NBRC 105648]GLZ43457.1 hypothetical protein Acsp05_70810 [Actinokineospora sp. NBRC 105648]
MAAHNLAAVDIGAGFSDAWRMVITFVPRLLGFALILVVGWFVAKFVAKLVDRVLERVGFDRVVERGGVKQLLARSNHDASDIIAKLVYYAILLITLQIAFGVWGANPVSALLTDIVAWLPRAAVAILIIVVAAAIARAAKDFLGNVLGGLSYGRLLATSASVFILALGVIAALNQIGVATTVTMPVLIAVLATAGGIAVVGVGGGLIRPMQSRWETWLDRAGEEIPRVREHLESHPVSGSRQGDLREPAHSAAAQARSEQNAEPTQYLPPVPPPGQGRPVPPQDPGGYPALDGPQGYPGQPGPQAPPHQGGPQAPPFGQTPPAH